LVPLTRLLIARIQGNPFFLEESVRALVETGVLVGERGAYCLAKPLDTLQVPATVQALLAARIDRLALEDKHLLQTAAVIGTEVPFALLQAIAEVPDEVLHRGLAHLQAAEFLYETSLFPERAYTFKHALTHEVAYGSLLQERRRTLHARIVEALEALAGDRLDDQVERLAQHALRGEVWEKALAYGCQAGDKALTRSAYREAVACYEQALAALEHLPTHRAVTEQAIDLLLGFRTALNALDEASTRIGEALQRAESLAQTLGDPLRLGWVYATLGAHCLVAGEVDRAIRCGQRARALAATLGHVGLQTRAHLSLGQAYHDIGAYPQAVEMLEWPVAHLQGALRAERFRTNGSVAVIARTWLSFCYAERGMFTAGRAMADEGLQVAETVQDGFSQVMACRGVSFVALRQGDIHRAIPVLERALGLCQEWHMPLFVSWLAAVLGLTSALAGRVASGLAWAEHGVEHALARGRLGVLVPVVAWLSEVYLLADRIHDAHTRAAQAYELARQYHHRGHQAWALHLLGAIAARREPPERASAATHYQQALALADELGMRPLQAHSHRSLGMLYSKTGQQEQAHTALSTAVDLYRAMEMMFWLPETEAALAQVKEG
jgi:tetratricopeptide (TPR) repeat protein